MRARWRLMLVAAVLPAMAGCIAINMPKEVVVKTGDNDAKGNSASTTSAPCDLAELAQPERSERPVLAVLDFQYGEDLRADDGRALADLCRTAVNDSGRFVLVDRARIADILGERDFAEAINCDTTVCLVEYGKLLDAEKMMHGRINRLGEVYVLAVAMTDVSTGEQVSRSANLEDVEESTDAIPELVCEIIRERTGDG